MTRILTDQEAAARISSAERELIATRTVELRGLADLAERAGVSDISLPLPGTPMGSGYSLASLHQVYVTRRAQGDRVGDFAAWVNAQLRAVGAPEIPAASPSPRRGIWSRIFGR